MDLWVKFFVGVELNSRKYETFENKYFCSWEDNPNEKIFQNGLVIRWKIVRIKNSEYVSKDKRKSGEVLRYLGRKAYKDFTFTRVRK